AFMHRVVVLMLVAALVIPVPAVVAAPGGAETLTGTIKGTATPAGIYTVRLRNMQSNEVVDTKTTAANGAYSYTNVPVGQYIVEIDSAGNVIGTTAAVALTAGATVTANVTLSGAAAQGQQGGSKDTAASIIIATAAAAAGIAATIAVVK